MKPVRSIFGIKVTVFDPTAEQKQRCCDIWFRHKHIGKTIVVADSRAALGEALKE
jgi:hypothetical protein